MPKGMEAVLERTTEAGKEAGGGKKKAVLAKKVADKLAQGPGGKGPKGPKGPGMAVMIAIGAPKKGMEGGSGAKTEDTPMRDGFQSRSSSTEAILAKMEARIAALEAKLAESESESEGEEEEGEYEDEEMED